MNHAIVTCCFQILFIGYSAFLDALLLGSHLLPLLSIPGCKAGASQFSYSLFVECSKS